MKESNEKLMYKDIILNLNKDTHFNSSIIENTDNECHPFTDMVLKLNEYDIPLNIFEIASKICSVCNMSYQINNGGIDQYYLNCYDEDKDPCNKTDLCHYNKRKQIEFLYQLCDFGNKVFPNNIKLNENFQLFILRFREIEYYEEEITEEFICDEDEYIIDEDGNEIENPDWYEHETVVTGHEMVLSKDGSYVDNVFYEISDYFNILVELYSQYVIKQIHKALTHIDF